MPSTPSVPRKVVSKKVQVVSVRHLCPVPYAACGMLSATITYGTGCFLFLPWCSLLIRRCLLLALPRSGTLCPSDVSHDHFASIDHIKNSKLESSDQSCTHFARVHNGCRLRPLCNQHRRSLNCIGNIRSSVWIISRDVRTARRLTTNAGQEAQQLSVDS